MSKHRRFVKQITTFFIAAVLSVTVLQASAFAQYSADSYGACAYGETCTVATTDDSDTTGGLSDTGDNQKLFLYGALILLGAAITTYTIKRKRSYKLKS